MVKPIILPNDKKFKSTKEAIQYFQSILNGNKIEFRSDDPEYSDILSLYQRHTEYNIKTKPSQRISHFLIKESVHKSKCFHTVHEDATIIDWSYISAITGKSSNDFDKFSEAAYEAAYSEPYENRFSDPNFKQKTMKFIKDQQYEKDNFPYSEWLYPNDNTKIHYKYLLKDDKKNIFIKWYNSQTS